MNQAKQQGVVDLALEARLARRIVGPLAVSGGVGLLVPALRDRFYSLDPQGREREVFQMSALGGGADLALGVEFP